MLELKKSHKFSFHLESTPRHLIEERQRKIGRSAMRILEPTSPIKVKNESSLDDDEHWVLKAGLDPAELEHYLDNMTADLTDDDRQLISGSDF